MIIQVEGYRGYQGFRELDNFPTEKAMLQEIENRFDKVVTIHSPEMQGNFSIQDEHVFLMCQQISEEINTYNQGHPGEMLPQDPDDLHQQFKEKNSIIIAGQKDGVWQFLHHCTTYNLLNTGQVEAIGWNVVEYGTAITHEPLRSGYKLGQQGVQSLKDQILEMWGDKTIILATIKQHATGMMFGKVDAVAISWEDHPYLSFLTDSCDTSPAHTGVACEYRRPVVESTQELLYQATTTRGKKMPCTLIVFDSEKARTFEEIARQAHQGILQEFIETPTDDRTNPGAWSTMQVFYQALSTLEG